MTKQECLEKLRALTFAPKSQAEYWMACNYFCTVKELTEEEFATVEPWYKNAIKEMME